MKLCIVNTRSANFNSVVQAIKRLGVEPTISDDLKELAKADRLIMPGVGTASAVMNGIIQSELKDFIVSYQRPLLGICLGMQVQAAKSCEVPKNSDEDTISTLNIVDGVIHKIDSKGLPLPHMGWNTIEHNDHPLFKNIPQHSYFYFVHSYCLDVTTNTIASCEYGQKFSAAIAKDNFMGVQFHPEKSGALGAQLLQNFLTLD